jgi:hypothetical protein
MTNDQIGDEAEARAKAIADEINAKASAAGCTRPLCHAHGSAHITGPTWHRRYTGHIQIFFEAIGSSGPRRRTVNDVKKPIDVDKIVGMLVEYQRYMDARDARWKEEREVADRIGKVAEELRNGSPSWLSITSSISGIHIHADSMSPAQARAIVDALRVLP